MENLNAEQIIKELEGLANFRTCPEYIKDALALVKELTEENERLRASSVDYRNIPDIIADTRAGAVRKMQELIKERCIKGGIYPAFVARTIDQIAKEMVEDKG